MSGFRLVSAEMKTPCSAVFSSRIDYTKLPKINGYLVPACDKPRDCLVITTDVSGEASVCGFEFQFCSQCVCVYMYVHVCHCVCVLVCVRAMLHHAMNAVRYVM